MLKQLVYLHKRVFVAHDNECPLLTYINGKLTRFKLVRVFFNICHHVYLNLQINPFLDLKTLAGMIILFVGDDRKYVRLRSLVMRFSLRKCPLLFTKYQLYNTEKEANCKCP